MATWWIDGRVGVHGQLVVRWRSGRIAESRFPVDDIADFWAEVDVYKNDWNVRSIERIVDGQVVERIVVS